VTRGADGPPSDAIVIEVDLPADSATAWRAVTDPAEVAEWFASVTPIDGIGSPYRIDFGDGSLVEGRVRALDPGRRFSYTWAWADGDGGTPTLVTWEVDARAGGGSLVRLIHEGWVEAGLDTEARDEHAEYWEGYLAELASLFDVGQIPSDGYPDPR
jgi:uncharacterized protein YndB with AHSA1/START domain